MVVNARELMREADRLAPLRAVTERRSIGRASEYLSLACGHNTIRGFGTIKARVRCYECGLALAMKDGHGA